jgi:hypothetical protein
VLVVLICWRGLAVLVPVPAAPLVRLNGMTPRSLVKSSSGSFALNGMFAALAVGPVSSRRPNVWSRNWPQVQPHWVTRRSENTFWLLSSMMRLLTYRTFGPVCIAPIPSW